MRLGDFILRDIEPILAEWDKFASTMLPAAKDMTSGALRDHARAILEAFAKDLATVQTRQEEIEKSKGRPQRFWAPPRLRRRRTQSCVRTTASTSTSSSPSIVRYGRTFSGAGSLPASQN